MSRRQGAIFAPVGDTLYNGLDAGGARIYPINNGLAIQPSSQFSDYIGAGSGISVVPPVAALSGTTGVASTHPGVSEIMANPFGRTSPLLWVVGGLFLAVGATHYIHYAERKRG